MTGGCGVAVGVVQVWPSLHSTVIYSECLLGLWAWPAAPPCQLQASNFSSCPPSQVGELWCIAAPFKKYIYGIYNGLNCTTVLIENKIFEKMDKFLSDLRGDFILILLIE